MRNVLVLAIAQFFGACGQVVTALLVGLIGGDMAPDPRLATVPLTLATLGIAAATLPAGLLMRRYGRRRVFMGAAAWSASGAVLAIAALFPRVGEWLIRKASGRYFRDLARARRTTQPASVRLEKRPA